MKVQEVGNATFWTLCVKCHKQKWGKAMGKDVCDTTLLYQNRNETFSKKKGKDTNQTKKKGGMCVCVCVFVCVSVYTGNESDIKI